MVTIFRPYFKKSKSDLFMKENYKVFVAANTVIKTGILSVDFKLPQQQLEMPRMSCLST